jgi:serine/threonine protein kinase
MEYSVGDKIGGRYEVHRIFGGPGQSGMGVVYVCYDHKTGVVLALKTYQEGFFHDKILVDHFKRGALAWTQLDRHPYVVQAVGVLKLSGRLFLGLEYVAPDGQGRNNLSHYLRDSVELERILLWGIQFCDAMEHARTRNITPHRDIKPDNLLITHSRQLKVSDFDLAGTWQGSDRPVGVAAAADRGREGMTFIRDADDKGVMGTLPWMAPEQFDGNASLQSDLYSFGIILYQLCHQGALPYQPEAGGDWRAVHQQALVPETANPLSPIIRRLLAKDPSARYGGSQPEQGFIELRTALAELYRRELPGKPLPTPPAATELKVGDLNDRGVSLTYLGLHKAALKSLKQAMELKPAHAPTYLNLGVALSEMGETEKAGKAYLKALNLDPQMGEAYHNYALLCKNAGRQEEAEQKLREAIRLNPEMHSAYEQLGILTSEAGRHQEAIALMQDAVRRDPLYAGYHYSLGVALENAGQFPESLASYQEAVRLTRETPATTMGWATPGVIWARCSRRSPAGNAPPSWIPVTPWCASISVSSSSGLVTRRPATATITKRPRSTPKTPIPTTIWR